MNIKKRCNKAGCKEYVDISKTYCSKHENHSTKEYNKQYERMRKSTEEGREYKRFYDSKEWKSLRYQVLLESGFLCKICLDNGVYSEAEIGDHIIPTKVRWDLRLDRDNVQGVCKECHNKKTLEDKKKYNL